MFFLSSDDRTLSPVHQWFRCSRFSLRNILIFVSVVAGIVGSIRGWKLKSDQFEAIATVILRVPGYFILDYWYQNDVHNCIPQSLAWADVVSSGFAICGESLFVKSSFWYSLWVLPFILGKDEGISNWFIYWFVPQLWYKVCWCYCYH